jgi:hypothetical protein
MTTRRYEVLLPTRFNDGHEVFETCYDDQLYRLVLDVPDTDDSRHWIATFKKELRSDDLDASNLMIPIVGLPADRRSPRSPAELAHPAARAP